MIEELSTNELRALDSLCKQWIFANKDLTVAEADEEQLDGLVAYHKIKRELEKRSKIYLSSSPELHYRGAEL